MCQPDNHSFIRHRRYKVLDGSTVEQFYCLACGHLIVVRTADAAGNPLGEQVGTSDLSGEAVDSRRAQRKLHLLDCAVRTAALATEHLQADIPLAVFLAHAENAERIIGEGSELGLLPDDQLIGLVEVRSAVLRRIRELESQQK